jgi:hypothetical protein
MHLIRTTQYLWSSSESGLYWLSYDALKMERHAMLGWWSGSSREVARHAHGYCTGNVASRTARLASFYRYCCIRDVPGGIYEMTNSTSSSIQHCTSRRRGNSYTSTGKASTNANTALQRFLFTNETRQSAAKQLSSFDIQRFRLAVVG